MQKVLVHCTFELEDLNIWCDWNDPDGVKWFENDAFSKEGLCLLSGEIGDEISHTCTDVKVEYVKEE